MLGLKACTTILATLVSFKDSLGAGEIAHWLRTHIALIEDSNSVFSAHTRKVKSATNSRPRGCDVLFWPLWAPVCMW